MATVSTATRSIEVTLSRPDISVQTYTLPEGATLGDLLRQAGAVIRSPNLLIDGRTIQEVTPLESGMAITILPETPESSGKGSWLDTVGMFEDDADFEAMVQAGRVIREADRRATREEAEREGA